MYDATHLGAEIIDSDGGMMRPDQGGITASLILQCRLSGSRMGPPWVHRVRFSIRTDRSVGAVCWT
jgi:hypothetical protein